MVQLVFDGRTETLPLEELKGLSAGDLLKKVFNDDLEKAISSKLIYDGRILNATTLLGELNDIADTKHFRIVSRQPPKPSVTVTVDQKKLEALQRVVTSIQEHERTQLTMALMDQLSDSRHLHKQTKEWPALLEDPVACQVVNDHFLILALLGEELDAKKREFLNAHPIVIDVLYGMLMKAHNPRRMPPPQQLLPEPVVPVQMITPDMLQRAMQAALGAFQPQRQQIPTASTAAIPQQPTVPPPAERFQAQLAQLIEFGFTNEERNLEMLLVTDGNVEQALDLLISQREEGNY